MQAPVVAADTFQHLPDTLVRGTTATLPGGPKFTGAFLVFVIVAINFVLIVAAMRGFKRAGGVKTFLSDFPTQNAGVALALILIFETGLVVLIRLALGLVFPDNYDTWIYALVGLAGVNVLGLGVKRFSDDRYVEAKARGKAAGSPSVNVEGDASITAERRTVTTEATATSMSYPQAGTKPRDPSVRQPIEEYAERQRKANDDDPGII